MPALTELSVLLASLAPRLVDGEWVFLSLPARGLPSGLTPLATFQENEGLTAICLAAQARDHRLPYEGTYRQIVLEVHSSLAAVGLTAAVSGALARENIPCNVVAAFHHDHLFVPTLLAERALQILRALSHSPAA